MIYKILKGRYKIPPLDVLKVIGIFALIHLMEVAFFILPHALNTLYLPTAYQDMLDMGIAIVSKLMIIHFLFKWFALPRSEKTPPKDFVFGLTLAFLALVGFRLVYDQTIAYAIQSFVEYDAVNQAINNALSNPVYGFLLVVIISPIYEEIIYRGFLFQGIKEKYNATSAIAISAVLFSIMHFNLIQSTHALFLGILLGYIYQQTASLTVTCLVHMINNLMVLFFPFSVFEWANTQLALWIAPILVLIGLAILIPSIKKMQNF